MKIIGIYFFVGLIHFAFSFTYSDEDRLRKDLFLNYSEEIGPIRSIINIDAYLEMYQFIDLEITTGIMVTLSRLKVKWEDERLKWRPQDYGNIKKIDVNPSKVWIPKVVVCNSEHNDQENINNLVVSNDGVISLSYISIMRTICKINIMKYPFDEHNCSIVLCSISQGSRDIGFKRFDLVRKDRIKNSKWDIDMNSTTAKGNLTYYIIIAPVHISRKFTNNTVAMLLPIAVISILTSSVFLLPPESGERVSLATTVFLTNVVYLVEMDKDLSASSLYTPLLLIYLIALTSLSGLSALGTIVVCKLQIVNDASADEQQGKEKIGNKVAPMDTPNSEGELTSKIEPSLGFNVKSKKYRGYRLLDNILFGIIIVSFLIGLTVFLYRFSE